VHTPPPLAEIYDARVSRPPAVARNAVSDLYLWVQSIDCFSKKETAQRLNKDRCSPYLGPNARRCP